MQLRAERNRLVKISSIARIFHPRVFVLQGAENKGNWYENRIWSGIAIITMNSPVHAKISIPQVQFIIDRAVNFSGLTALLSDKLKNLEKGYSEMTKEEKIAKMETLRSEVVTSVKSYNEKMQDGKLDEAKKDDKDMTEKVNEYTSLAQAVCFENCKNAENPMIAAVKALTFKTIALKDEKAGEDEDIPVRVIIDKDKPIDLLKLHNYCGSIGANKDWSHIAQKMNFLLTAQKCIDLGVDPKDVNDSYAMSEIAHAFDMGKNPTSKTNMLKTLQTVITAMIGDGYKATSHDVNFLMSVYSKKGRKALNVACADHKYFRRYLAEVCHRIVEGKSYGVEFKAKKN